jgi:uncharacterized protein (DUF433 family)
VSVADGTVLAEFRTADNSSEALGYERVVEVRDVGVEVMTKRPEENAVRAGTLLAVTGAHLFHVTKGEHQTGGIGGIVREATVWGGRAVIEGTRIPVFVIVDQFDESGTIERVLEAYPELKRADVHVVLAYAELDHEGVTRDRETYVAVIPPEARIG